MNEQQAQDESRKDFINSVGLTSHTAQQNERPLRPFSLALKENTWQTIIRKRRRKSTDFWPTRSAQEDKLSALPPTSVHSHDERPISMHAKPVHEVVHHPLHAIKSLQTLTNSSVIGVDCSGVNLSRDGELCAIFVCQFVDASGRLQRPHVYVFDVMAFGSWLFDAGLRSILESESITKIVYDCRADADILLHKYNVLLDGVRDLQLLMSMMMPPNSYRLVGYTKARSFFVGGFDARRQILRTRRIYAETPNIWKVRPFNREILEYCVDNLRCYFKLQRVLASMCNLDTVAMTAWKIASCNYAHVLRQLPYRTYDRYEASSVLPLRIIPNWDGNSLVSFEVPDRACIGCRRFFHSSEMQGSKCTVCTCIDEKQINTNPPKCAIADEC